MSARGEPGVDGPKARGPKDKRQADRSDVRQEFARKRARTGFEPLDKRTGASPSCRECLLNPCLLMLPFRFAHPMRIRPLSVGRVDNAFHPATGSHSIVRLFCKEFSLKSFSVMTAPFAGLSRSGGRHPQVQTTRPRARRTFRLSLSRNAFIGFAHAYADWCRRVSPLEPR